MATSARADSSHPQASADDMMWGDNSFALADGFDESIDRHTGLVAHSRGTPGPITDATLLVHPALAP